ncbi:hypothetical protein RB597_009498 [Gaeumannomyces tritici]
MDFTEQPGGLPPSLLAAGFGPDDFDYDAFLESAQDADYLAEESSASNRSSGGDGSEPQPAMPLGASSSSFQVAISSYYSAAAAVAQVPLGDSSSSGDSSRSPPPPKQRLERRGHTKSRRGCFNCKRRRIKVTCFPPISVPIDASRRTDPSPSPWQCQENRPACGHCVKTGLKCEYPAAALVVVHQPRHQAPVFTLQDMRFFQHFLLRCYPHQPLNNDAVWTHEVPCLSQEHDYLMHAVLGLAASDLAQDDPSLYEAAMSHRLKAIKAVKKALADSPRRARQQRQQQQQQANSSSSSSSGGGGGGGGGSFTSDEGNALLATCYALTFQSVLLDDGMAEYMTFIRGIIIVMIQMYTSGARFLFSNFVGDEQDAILKPLMDRVPMIDRRRAEAAAAAVAGLEPLVAAAALPGSGGDDDGGAATAAAYHAHLTAMAAQMRASPYGAYKAVAAHYGWWMQLPHARFRALVDDAADDDDNNNKNNNKHVFALLASHWVAVKMVLRPVTEVEMRVSAAKQQLQQQQRQRRGDGLEGGMARWLCHLNAQVPSEYAAYNRWPVWVQEQMARDPGFFGTAGGGGGGDGGE